MSEKEVGPCPCGGSIEWAKENVTIDKESFKLLEVGKCPLCHARFLSNDAAALVVDKLRHKR